MVTNIAKKKTTATLDGQEIQIPKMTHRPVQVVVPYIHAIARLPTSTLFLVSLRTFLTRIKDGWQEKAWHDYFVSQYLYRAAIKPVLCGESEALAAKWWYGSKSPISAGHVLSQQTVEQAHRHFKRCITDAPGRTLIDVLESLRSLLCGHPVEVRLKRATRS